MTQRQYAMAGMLAPLIFWTTYLSMSSLRPDYSIFTKAVSELGSVDAPFRWFWNMFGYILPGVLICIFAFGLFKHISGGKDKKLPMICMGLSGLFMTLSGIFPADFDNRQSLTMLLHSLGSFGSYIFFLISAFTFPSVMKKYFYWRPVIIPMLIFVFLTIVFGAWPFVFSDMPAVGQRFVFFFYLLWVFYLALLLFRQPEMSKT